MAIKNIRIVHSVSTNQIADILHFNNGIYYKVYLKIKKPNKIVCKSITKGFSYRCFNERRFNPLLPGVQVSLENYIVTRLADLVHGCIKDYC